MRKLLLLTAAPALVVAFMTVSQATPMSASGTLATSGIAAQALPDEGIIQARWWRGRGYGWRGGYGWRRPYARCFWNRWGRRVCY